MTDIYSFPDPGDPVEFSRRRALVQAQLGLEDSPDDAARAYDLGQATGTPPSVVRSDLDRIDAQYKAKLTSGIVGNNQYIQDYVNSHPLAAAISNDDYGQLDAASGAIAKVGQKGFIENTGDIIKGVYQGLASGPTEYKHLAAGSEDFLLKLGMDPASAKREAEFISKRAYRNEEITNALFAIPTAIASPVFGAFRTYVAQPLERAYGIPSQVTEGLSMALAGFIGLHQANKMAQTAERVAPYVKNGEIPPPGIDPLVDKIHIEQAKADKEALNEALSEAQKSTTRERAPDLFAEFARQHTDAKIGVSADAIRQLYGDKIPEPDDGILGWVPGIADRLMAAEATGGDVEIPLADYLARVEPEVAKELADHVRLRPGGVTVDEGKNLAEGIEAYHGSPYEFEAFGNEAIGTGEGAQSYGYGHYLAENPEVADSYSLPRDKFGVPYGRGEGRGNLYHARILRRPEEFLDYDAPIDRNDPRLQAAYAEANMDLSGATDVQDMYSQLATRLGGEREIGQEGAKYPIRFTDEAKASALLQKHGIPGIKYLDQGSRDIPTYKADLESALKESETATGLRKGEIDRQIAILEQKVAQKPTSNFVVFDPKDIQIISRNGEALRSLRQATGLEPSPMGAKPEEPVSGASHAELKAPFAGPPPGFTKEMYNLYLRAIAKRQADDADWLSKRALEFQRKTQSAEWKANRAELRPLVADELKSQPVFAADEILRKGDIKLASSALTDEQRAGLPSDWLAKDGIHPDDLAGVVGLDTGSELVSQLSGLHAARGDIKPEVFARDQIDHLTDQRMLEKYGDLDKNIIAEAKDQVLSDIQEEILHQETMARANEAGLQYSIPPDQLRAAVIRHFNSLPATSVSADKFLADAGRAGRKAEVAGLKGDAAGAFREAQRREFAFIAAREAKKVEREVRGFERLSKRFSNREVAGVDQEYTDWIHTILRRIGGKVNRSDQDLAASIDRRDQKTLGEFADYKESYGLREIPIADFLTEPNWRKDYDSLNVEEFRALRDSVKALAHNGADEQKILKAGEAADLEAVKAKMLDQIKSFKAKAFGADRLPVESFAGIRHTFRTALVSHLQAETVMNRLDRFDPKGVFSQYVFRELASGANNEALMLREYSKKLGAIADDANLREKVPNNIFSDPFLIKRDTEGKIAEYGPPIAMTRKNLRAVILNLGNENNAKKLARGYGLDPQTILDWTHQHSTKADWDWAQKVWDAFAELKDKSDTMYRSIAGIEPEGLEIKAFDTPFGRYRGGYYPLIRHPLLSADVKTFENGLEGQGYVRATTPAGYTKKRTGATYPLSLDLDSLPNQMRQVIHDISLRPAVLQAAKIFYDKNLMAAMSRHLGPEYANMFMPWLRDVANVQNYMPQAMKDFGYWSDFARQNAITTLVGFNIGTALKHTPTALISSMAEVGPVNFLKALRSMVGINEETGDRQWRFAISQSEELQRRSRNWSETMGGGLAQLEGRTVGKALTQRDYGSAFMGLREAITELSSKPVALGDLLSAVPTWIAKYEAEMKDHGIHGDSVAAADKAVRQAHGSSAITSRSQVARSQSALAKWLTGFFTFFNDIFNRQVETVWRAGQAIDLAKAGNHTEAMAEAKNVAGRLFAYVIAPAMIEELVTPLTDKDHDSWGKKAAKSLLFTLSSSWAGVRDVVNAALNKRDPSVGLLTTYAKSVTDFIRDFETKKGTKPENVIKHGTQLSGMLTGLTPAPIGRAAEFGYKVKTGQERPRGPWGWLVGLRYGTLKGHSTTLEDWMKGK